MVLNPHKQPRYASLLSHGEGEDVEAPPRRRSGAGAAPERRRSGARRRGRGRDATRREGTGIYDLFECLGHILFQSIP